MSDVLDVSNLKRAFRDQLLMTADYTQIKIAEKLWSHL